jgi:hypothetical protein
MDTPDYFPEIMFTSGYFTDSSTKGQGTILESAGVALFNSIQKRLSRALERSEALRSAGKHSFIGKEPEEHGPMFRECMARCRSSF